MMEILKSSLTVSFFYCVYCFALHQVLRVISNAVFGKSLKSLTKKSRKIWYNKAVSIVHAITMFYLTMHYWIMENPTMAVATHIGVSEARCLDYMMGYLWYDSIFEVMSDGQVDTLGHHVLGLISHMSTRLSNNGGPAFTSMLVYIAEGSTPLLHTSWLMHQFKMGKTAAFKAMVALLIFSFFVCRILLSPYMLWHMLIHRAEWGMENVTLFWGNWAIVALFGLLNYFWFYKLTSLALKP